jgi:hypothetical protein
LASSQLIVFWSITSILLLILATTLPDDTKNMETELANYAESMSSTKESSSMQISYGENYKELDSKIFDDSERFQILDDNLTLGGDESIVSIEDRMSSFDAAAARESWVFIEGALREIAQLGRNRNEFQSIDEIWDAPIDDDHPFEVEDGHRIDDDDRRFTRETDTLL